MRTPLLRTAELDVEQVRLAILKYARDRGVPPDLLIAALADLVAMVAASLDKNGAQIPFEERLGEFDARARQLYNRIGLMQPGLGYNFAPGALPAKAN